MSTLNQALTSIANLWGKIARLETVIPSFQVMHVTALSPFTLIPDPGGDPLLGVANWCQAQVGDRVLVLHWLNRAFAIATSKPPVDPFINIRRSTAWSLPSGAWTILPQFGGGFDLLGNISTSAGGFDIKESGWYQVVLTATFNSVGSARVGVGVSLTESQPGDGEGILVPSTGVAGATRVNFVWTGFIPAGGRLTHFFWQDSGSAKSVTHIASTIALLRRAPAASPLSMMLSAPDVLPLSVDARIEGEALAADADPDNS